MSFYNVSAIALSFIYLLPVTVGVTLWFLEQERLLYYFDIRFYHQLTLQSWQAAQSWPVWLDFLQQGFSQDYNAIYTIPLLPFIGLAEFATELNSASRALYLALLALCYLTSAAVIAGVIARQIYPALPLGLSAAMMLCSAALWQPLLRGYPDVGGVLLLGLALCLYLCDMQLKRWRSVLGLAMLCALIILFRRHFAYAVVALFIAIGLTQLFSQRLQDSARSLLRLITCGLLMVGIMFLIAPDFTRYALLVNYNELYQSFRQSPTETAVFLWQGFGLVLPALGILGWCLAWRRGHIASRTLLFFSSLLAVWVLLFVFFVRQPGHQYRIHYVPLLNGIGLSLLIYECWRWRHKMQALLVMCVALAIVGYAIIGANLRTEPVGERARSIISTLLLPEAVAAWRYHEQDYDTYLRLANLLQRETAQHEMQERIYVAASSNLLNEDILRSAREQLNTQGTPFNFLPAAIVDSRDFLPLVSMVAADIVVTSQPALLTVPTQQRVVQLAADVFADRWPFSDDFVRLAEQFQLKDGIQIVLYRRQRETSLAVFIDTLARMQKIMKDVDLGAQQQWISSDWDAISVIRPLLEKTRIRFHHQVGTAASVVNITPIEGDFYLQGEQTLSSCTQATLTIDLYHPQGQHLGRIAQVELQQKQFSIEVTSASHGYLVLGLDSASETCVLELRNVKVINKTAEAY